MKTIMSLLLLLLIALMNCTQGPSLVVEAGLDIETDEGIITTFEAKVSNAVQGEDYYYRWDFGDEQFAEGDLVVTHNYMYQGTYQARITVTDKKNHSVSDTVTVRVINMKPEIRKMTGIPRKTRPGEEIEIDITMDKKKLNYSYRFKCYLIEENTGEIVDANTYDKIPIKLITPMNHGSYGIQLCVTDQRGRSDCQTSPMNVERVGYIFPMSDKKRLNRSDIFSIASEEISYARQEILARRGLAFNEDKYKDYFSSKEWYKPNVTKPEEIVLNNDEAYNLRYLQFWDPEELKINQVERKRFWDNYEKEYYKNTYGTYGNKIDKLYPFDREILCDMDMDGMKEKLIYTSGSILKVDISLEQMPYLRGSTCGFAIVDIDETDAKKELIASECRGGNDTESFFYEYNERQIRQIGKAKGSICSDDFTFFGNGIFESKDDPSITYRLDPGHRLTRNPSLNIKGPCFAPLRAFTKQEVQVIDNPSEEGYLSTIPEGQTVLIEANDKDPSWLLIKPTSGKAGWIKLSYDKYFEPELNDDWKVAFVGIKKVQSFEYLFDVPYLKKMPSDCDITLGEISKNGNYPYNKYPEINYKDNNGIIRRITGADLSRSYREWAEEFTGYDLVIYGSYAGEGNGEKIQGLVCRRDRRIVYVRQPPKYLEAESIDQSERPVATFYWLSEFKPIVFSNLEKNIWLQINETYLFSGYVVDLESRKPILYEWDLDYKSGQFKADKKDNNFEMKWDSPGRRRVALRATNNMGISAVDITNVTVVPVNYNDTADDIMQIIEDDMLGKYLGANIGGDIKVVKKLYKNNGIKEMEIDKQDREITEKNGIIGHEGVITKKYIAPLIPIRHLQDVIFYEEDETITGIRMHFIPTMDVMKGIKRGGYFSNLSATIERHYKCQLVEDDRTPGNSYGYKKYDLGKYTIEGILMGEDVYLIFNHKAKQ